MRTISLQWAKGAKDLDRPQDELPKDLISRSGRIRKIKDISGSYLVGKDKNDKPLAKSDKVTATTVTTTKLEDLEKVEAESGNMEAEVTPVPTVEETPNEEATKDNKSRVNLDLLQKVLGESVEEWFSFSEVVKSNKGKPYKKRKIVLPPFDESEFSFELTETKDTGKNPEDGNKRIDSTSDKEPETVHSEESKTEDVALEMNEKVDNAVIKKERKTTKESCSIRTRAEVLKNEQDKHDKKEETKMVKASSKTDEVSENEKENMTENGKNKNFRHFFALILYGDGETVANMTTADSKQEISRQQGKTVIKTLDLETSDLKEFEVELGDFSKLPKDSPIFECVNGIEKLLQTGTNGSTLRKSLSAECLNVIPKSDNDRAKNSAETPATLPSRQRKMKARECFFVLKKDIIEKYKRNEECKSKQEAEKLTEIREEEVNEEEKEEHPEIAKMFTKEDSNEMIVGKTEQKKEPKKNIIDREKIKKLKVNGSIEEKAETGQEEAETKVVTNGTFTRRAKLMMEKRMNGENDNKMSGMKCKKKKRHSSTKQHKIVSYVNKIKRKSGYKSSSESPESQKRSNEEPTSKAFENSQDTRVDDEKATPKREPEVDEKTEETKEIRKSHREIRLTHKLVHMIATSHRRTRRSPSIREETVEEVDYDYPNLLKKVVSGTVTHEVVESHPSSSATDNCLEPKMEANASDFVYNWKPGDLVWARFAGSPFWPSLILRDPFSNNEYAKTKAMGRIPRTFVHLQFLADSGRRAWVPEHYCMSFNGLEEFEKIKSNLPEIDAFSKRSDIIYQKAFFTTKSMENAWLDAVKEADTVRTKSKDERITYMTMKYPLIKKKSVRNSGLVCNGSTSVEPENPQLIATRRTTRSSSLVEPVDLPDTEKEPTPEETCSKGNESFECVKPTDSEDNNTDDKKEAPKITLKLVRSPKKEAKRKWNMSLESNEGQLAKKAKTNVQNEEVDVSKDRVSKSQKKVGSSKGGKTKEVCRVCLKMVEKNGVTKCNGCLSKGNRKEMGAEGPSLEEGAAPAFKKKERKLSTPRVNKWKEKLWAIFDFYNQFGGCEREGMDMQALVSLYQSVCRNKRAKKRRPAKIRKAK